MHLLSTSSTSLDDIVEPVDLRQTPGDIAILSFADSDLAGLAAAWDAECDALPSVRLVQLRDLKHPMSVDLWIERVALGIPCRCQPREIAVSERQDRDVARRLTEIDRLDDIVEAR